jgi:hypothetical protein
VFVVSDEQADQPLTGRARSLANLRPFPKGRSPNPGEKPKDLAKFGDLQIRSSIRPSPPIWAEKTVKKTQGEIVAQQMVKNAILKGPAAMSLLLKFIEAHEARQAAREALKAK